MKNPPSLYFKSLISFTSLPSRHAVTHFPLDRDVFFVIWVVMFRIKVNLKPHTVDGSDIQRSPVRVGSLSHYLRRLIHPSWLLRISEPSTVFLAGKTSPETQLKNISRIGSFPQVRVKRKNIRNHHWDWTRFLTSRLHGFGIIGPPIARWRFRLECCVKICNPWDMTVVYPPPRMPVTNEGL